MAFMLYLSTTDSGVRFRGCFGIAVAGRDGAGGFSLENYSDRLLDSLGMGVIMTRSPLGLSGGSLTSEQVCRRENVKAPRGRVCYRIAWVFRLAESLPAGTFRWATPAVILTDARMRAPFIEFMRSVSFGIPIAGSEFKLKSLILAQNERWRRG